MTCVKAIIRPLKLDDVRAALDDIGVVGMTVTEVRGYGKQRGYTERYRGTEYTITLLHKACIEIFVPDDRVEDVVEAVLTAARTGEIGDGKIFLIPVAEAIRIRTGERGDDSL
jgi:nitrogen regulatory protein P-II 1